MGAAAILNIHRGSEFVRSVPIEGEAVLGRGEGCVIRLDDRAVSRHHAVFKTSSSGVLVERKSEFAPVLLNGVDCESGVLKNGDVIEIGPYLVRVELKSETVKTPSDIASVPARELGDPSIEVPLAATGDGLGSPVDESEIEEMAESIVRPVMKLRSEDASVEPSDSNDGAESGRANDLGDEFAPAGFGREEKTKVLTTTDVLVKLVIPEGVANITEFEVTKDEVTIGRDEDCDVILYNEKKCSRKHAVIKKTGLNFTLEDLSSANGTLLNGEPVSEIGLSGGDVIRIGDTEITFKAKSAEGKDLRSADVTMTQVSAPDLMAGTALSNAEESGTSMATSAMTSSIAPIGASSENGFVEKAHTAFLNLSKMNAVPIGVLGEGTSVQAGLESGDADEEEPPRNFIDKIVKDIRRWPKRKKVIWGACGVVLLVALVFGNPEPPAQPVKSPAEAGQKKVGFDALSADQRAFIQERYKSAQKHFEAQEYDEALFDLKKIFDILADYEPARELEKYINEKKRLKALAEVEKKRREEDLKLKERLAEIEKAVESLMKERKFTEAKELFPSVLALDPNSEKVAAWEKRILEEELKQQALEEKKRVEKKLNENAWMAYKAAHALRRQGKCLDAIESFQEVLELEVTDRRPLKLARRGIAGCRSWIKAKRDPLLAKGKQHEAAQELELAYQSYRQANLIDPGNSIAVAGMNRVKGVLHDRARVLFNEAIVAESYSDFDSAYKKFKDCAAIAPEDDVYYERSQRKIARYRGDRVFGDGSDAPPSSRLPASVSSEQVSSTPSPESTAPSPSNGEETSQAQAPSVEGQTSPPTEN